MNELTGAVIGAAIEVHRVLGAGFLESVYEEALAIELELRGIRFSRQKVVAVAYKGRKIGEGIAVAIKVTTFFNGPNDHVPVINPGAFCPGAFCLLL